MVRQVLAVDEEAPTPVHRLAYACAEDPAHAPPPTLLEERSARRGPRGDGPTARLARAGALRALDGLGLQRFPVSPLRPRGVVPDGGAAAAAALPLDHHCDAGEDPKLIFVLEGGRPPVGGDTDAQLRDCLDTA